MPCMIQIGKLTIDAPFFQAGLAGYSDTAMRMVARKHGCPMCVTEAMLDQFLINGGKGLKAAEIDPEDHLITGQLMGSHPDDIAQGCKILVGLGYDIIDVNLACPVKKIRKKARGGHLLQEPDAAIDILKSARQAVGDDVPCTVKLRRATDETPESAANFYRIFQAVIDLGYAGAVVHGRSVDQKYNGPSRWSFLKELVDQYGQTPNFIIGGSGDIWEAQDIFRMIQQTGVDIVSVARGCIGNPWIFQQARALMANPNADSAQLAPTLDQQRHVLLEHFGLSQKLHGERMASMMMRKFGIKFSAHHPTPESVRLAFIAVKSLNDWQNVLENFYVSTSSLPVSS
ncbi:MAG: tRNA-dihydrouridine synthase family protein [Phycisphaeraceae bacterium]|nr:tRNA-dihydrouridine synthase family protein [Phycisphaeraceae bacterium]